MTAHACIPALLKYDRNGESIISLTVVSYSAQKVAGLASLPSSGDKVPVLRRLEGQAERQNGLHYPRHTDATACVSLKIGRRRRGGHGAWR